MTYAYVNSFDETYVAWVEVGVSPYLNDTIGSLISTNSGPKAEGLFGFPATAGVSAIEFEAMTLNLDGDLNGFSVYDSDGVNLGNIYLPSQSYAWYSLAKTDDKAVRFMSTIIGVTTTVSIRRCRLVYTEVAAAPKSYSDGLVCVGWIGLLRKLAADQKKNLIHGDVHSRALLRRLAASRNIRKP